MFFFSGHLFDLKTKINVKLGTIAIINVHTTDGEWMSNTLNFNI